MASPKVVIFFLFDGAGEPLAGVTCTFDTYKDDTGTNVANPAITDIGGGAYKFTPVFPTDKSLAYVIDTAGSNPTKVFGYLRPEDFDNPEQIQALWDIEHGKWQIHVSGGDANRLVLYKPDGVTVIKKFDLADAAGSATYLNPYRRTPV